MNQDSPSATCWDTCAADNDLGERTDSSKGQRLHRIFHPHVVAAIIGLVGAMLAPWVERVLTSDPVEVPDIVKPPGVHPSAVIPPVGGFGKWTDSLEVSKPYQAASDGFVLVSLGGPRPPPGADVLVGDSANQMRTVCIRVDGYYAGAVCPVAQGQWWVAKSRGGREGVTVRWMPVRR